MSGPIRNTAPIRACTCCGVVQAAEAFPPKAYRPDGSMMRDSRCGDCRRAARRMQRKRRAGLLPPKERSASPWAPDPVVAELNRIFAEWRGSYGARRLVWDVGRVVA
jgi:hypothetical protein